MGSNDLHFDMERHPLDEQTARRLLVGALEPEDAPPGYEEVTALVQAARGPATAEELGSRAAVVSAMAAVGVTGAAALAAPTSKGKRMFGKLASLKALGIAIPAMALTATGAAAATGNLPAPAQSAVHGALAHVGISVTSGTDTPGTGQPKGPDATGPAKYGLCKAFSSSNGHPNAHSVAFANLQAAATAAGHSVADFCNGVTPGNSANSGAGSNGPDDSGIPSGDNSNGGHFGPPTSTPGSEHTPTSTPAGPPTSTPGSEHTSTSVPAGPPTSTPGSEHTSTSVPAGPPSSTPAD